jgi:hypothetical protein
VKGVGVGDIGDGFSGQIINSGHDAHAFKRMAGKWYLNFDIGE